MKVKSFYGNSIKEALDKARRELGVDASIIASRQLRPEEGGGCEVVCGMDEPSPSLIAEAINRRTGLSKRDTEVRGTGAAVTANTVRESTGPGIEAPERAVQPRSQPAPEGRARRGVTRIRKQLEALISPAEDKFGSDHVRVELQAAGFGEELVNDIVAGVRQRQRQGGERDSSLRDEIATRLSCAPTLGMPGAERKVVALVGPPGAGKTTTLVKLAVLYGLRGRKPLHIISMDSWRVGGTDALRSYAAGMGVTFEALETAEALRQSLEEHTGKGMILIDTPGLSPADTKTMAPVASLLSTHPETDVQLVLPAYLASAAMASVAQRFRPFLPSKLVVTRTDCMDSWLPVAALALSLDKPLSFIGTGQLIPEDLEEASSDRITGFRDSEGKKSAISAA